MMTPTGEDALARMLLPGLEIYFRLNGEVVSRCFSISMKNYDSLAEYIDQVTETISEEGFATVEGNLKVKAKDILTIRPYNCEHIGRERWHY